MAAAIREFKEETGIEAKGDLIPLGSVKQRGGKTVFVWAFAGNWDDGCPIVSNCHQLEWPPKSGRFQEFPEIDQAQFFSIEQVRAKLKETQWPFVERLLAALGQCAKIAPGD